MPRMAKMSCRTKMTATTFETAGRALKSEVMMSFMPALREMRRSGRSTRSTRRMRSGRRKGRCAASMETSIVETMTKSRWFHTLEKSANRVGRGGVEVGYGAGCEEFQCVGGVRVHHAEAVRVQL